MVKNIKLLVSDYDQTFYLNDESIQNNIKAVEQFRKNNNIFVIATGRSFKDLKNKQNLYHFKYDYLIINHGATILDSKNNIIYNFSIDNEIRNSIKQDLHLKTAIETFCCSKLESRVDFKHQNLTKIRAKYKTKEIAMKINNTINQKYSSCINSYYVNHNSVEIISNKTNKAYAISLLANKLNIPNNLIYTIGDGYSDIEMIEKFNGYAINGAVEEVKKIAVGKCPSVEALINKIS